MTTRKNTRDIPDWYATRFPTRFRLTDGSLVNPPAPEALHDEIAAMFDDLDAHGGAVAYASDEQALDAASGD